jgi:hypothetical protein
MRIANFVLCHAQLPDVVAESMDVIVDGLHIFCVIFFIAGDISIHVSLTVHKRTKNRS